MPSSTIKGSVSNSKESSAIPSSSKSLSNSSSSTLIFAISSVKLLFALAAIAVCNGVVDPVENVIATGVAVSSGGNEESESSQAETKATEASARLNLPTCKQYGCNGGCKIFIILLDDSSFG